jgi:hypothetical protein
MNKKMLGLPSLVLAALLLPLALQAQTSYTIDVPSGAGPTAGQTWGGFGCSMTDLYQDIPDASIMASNVFGGCKMNILRVWIDAFTNLTEMENDFYTNYVASGCIAAGVPYGTTNLLLGVGIDDGNWPPPNMSIFDYADTLAQFILDVKTKWGVVINVTGVANEPQTWMPTQIDWALRYLRDGLNRRGLQNVQIVCPEAATDDSITVSQLMGMTNDPIAMAGLLAGASHSYAEGVCTNETDLLPAGMQYWVTEASDDGNENGDDPDYACTLLARLLNDVNHRVTDWVYFLGFFWSPNIMQDGDDAVKLEVYNDATSSIYTSLKYYYVQQFMNTFDYGAAFRSCQSATEGDMAYSTVLQKPAINAAAAQNPDGSWGIAIVNDTGITNALYGNIYYSATTYNVTVTVSELSSSGVVPFTMYYSQPGSHFLTNGTVNMTNGAITVEVASTELVSLRCAARTAIVPAAPVAGSATFVTNTAFTANWAYSTNAVRYYLDVSTSSGFSSFLTGYDNLYVGYVPNYTVTGLSPGTAYYYRVRAANYEGTSGDSSVTSVTTAANPSVPAAPAIITPTNDFSGFIANWAASPGAAAYYLDVSTNSSFSSYVTTSDPYNDSSDSYSNKNVGGVYPWNQVLNLAPNTQYYYRVRAANSSGTSGNSSVASIMTGSSIIASNYTSASGVGVGTAPDPLGPVASCQAGTQTGSYLNYSVTAPVTGSYDVAFRLADANSGQQLELENGSTVLGTLNVPNTGSWSNWQTVMLTNISLTAGTQTLQVYANIGGWCLHWISFIPPTSGGSSGGTAPAAPSSLSATAVSTNQINLSWVNNATNATGIVIQRSTGSTNSFAQLATLATNATSYSDTALSAGTTYYYQVAATNSYGSSPWSDIANATTTTSGGGSGVIWIGVYTNSATATNWVISGTGVTVTYTNDAPTNGGPSTGCLLVSLPLNSTNTSGGVQVLPSANLNATNYTAFEFDVKIEGALDSNGQIQQLQPVVQSVSDGWMEWAGPALTTISTNNGWQHIVAAVANVDGGNIANWAAINAVDAIVYDANWTNSAPMKLGFTNFKLTGGPGSGGTAPAAPSSLSATAVSTNQINLSWVNNATNATGIVVQRSTGSTNNFVQIATLAASATSYSDTTLSASTTYYYEVGATNSYGSSPWSNQADATTLTPTGVIWIAVYTNSVTATNWVISGTGVSVTYTNDAPTNGGPSTGCLLVSLPLNSTNTSGGVQVLSSTNINATNYTAFEFDVKIEGALDKNGQIQQLQPVVQSVSDGWMQWMGPALTTISTNNGWQHIVVAATNANGGSMTNWAAIDAVTAIVYDANWTNSAPMKLGFTNFKLTGGSGSGGTAPAAPSSLSATAVSTNQINLSWVNNATNATGIVIQRSAGSATNFAQLATLASTATSYSDTILSAGTTYYYQVAATNSYGSSPWSNQTNATTPMLPAAPSSLSATAAVATNNQISLSWVNNATNATGIVIQSSTGSTNSFAQIATVAATATSYTNTGLVAGTQYYYRVAATNSSGSSPWSNITNATTTGVLWVGVYTNSATATNWAISGTGVTVTYTNDAPTNGGPSTGCLLVSLPLNSTNTSGGVQVLPSTNLNATNYTAFEFDVKIEGALDKNGQIQQLQPVVQSVSDGWMEWAGPTLTTISTNNGWQHIVVAAANVDGGSITNWAAINAVDAIVYDANWTNSASMKLGFTNFKITGGP